MITVDTLKAAGLTSDQIVRVLECELAEKKLNRREQNRIAKRNSRYRQQENADCQQKTADKKIEENQRACQQQNADKSPHTPLIQSQRIDQSQITREWRPNSNGLLLADQKGLASKDLEEEIERFRDYYLARGTAMANWDAAWANWLRSPYRKGQANGHEKPLTFYQQSCAEWRSTLDQLREFGSGDYEPSRADVELFSPPTGRRS